MYLSLRPPSQGEAGVQGADGEMGSPGSVGPSGEPGQPGIPGTSPSIDELLQVSRVQEGICTCIQNR